MVTSRSSPRVPTSIVTVSPGFTSCAGSTLPPFSRTRPPRTASPAALRDLKKRTHQSQRSIRSRSVALSSPPLIASAGVAEAVGVDAARVVPALEERERRHRGLEPTRDHVLPARRGAQRFHRGLRGHRELKRELLAQAELRLDTLDAVGALLEAGELRCGRDRVVEVTQLVDEPAAERLAADPDAAARGRVDLVVRLLAVLGHFADELAIRVPYRLRDHAVRRGVQRLQWIDRARDRRRGDPVDVHSDLVEQTLKR